ncbi:hypothetical protein B9Z55_022631 [Caenorhabditis nigoni]|uniref:Uncharacterized protein n=1 Tax=Caenorhabditis nigoni TaxID=1611254 RepID=A0A2G5SLP6_9PELO|nr:hypothetical protein B9Z55_022631 [Caenorhabditis nigoni]
MHGSKPILLDVWKNGSLKTIRLCNDDIDNWRLRYTLDEDLLLFKSNPGRYLDTDFVYKKHVAFEKNGAGETSLWTMAIATREWTKHYVEFKTTNMVAACSPTGQVFVYGRNFDTRDFYIANAALRPKETWRSMVSQAIEADPIKKATLREVNEFIGNTFRTTLSDDVFSDRIRKEGEKGIQDGVYAMSPG